VTEDEAERRRTLNALAALGIARARHISAFYVGPRRAGLPHMLAALEQEGKIARVEIAGDGPVAKGSWWVLKRDLPFLRRLESGKGWTPRTTLLSPFDNLIINRSRAEELFTFHFRMEIYVTKAQRRYGYFVMPILHGGRLIGRIDPFFDRGRRELRLNGVFAEAGAPLDRSTGAAIDGAVRRLAAFLGAEEVVYPSHVPSGWKAIMR
ncbi:MAG: DNA glycosylase AlkZ-like family protein, partial [bacterium]